LRPTTGSLAVVNCDFHRQYEARVNAELNSFGAPGGRPVIFDSGSALTLKYNGASRTENITPFPYHEMKAVAHGAFAIFATLAQYPSDRELDAAAQTALENLLADLRAARSDLSSLGLAADDQRLCEDLADKAIRYLSQTEDAHSYTGLSEFYRDLTPELSAVIGRVAGVELHAIDQAVKPWLAQMAPEERQRVGVAIVTVHQARANEVSLQYFEKEFGFRVGEGAREENGLVVLEGGRIDEAAAFAQLARHYVDRGASLVIFGDPGRLQEDVLGRAAADILQSPG